MCVRAWSIRLCVMSLLPNYTPLFNNTTNDPSIATRFARRSYDPAVTVGGLMHCFNAACRLVPGIKDLEVEETWSGLRPTTPDKAPILGETPWENVHVAGGYWRNGVLLAPKTSQLIVDSIEGRLSDSDSVLLSAFKWDRFLDPEGGAKIAVASRYASQMHPVYYKSEGVGVSSSVGSELGLYEGAGAAVNER